MSADATTRAGADPAVRTRLRVLVVDDERLARVELRALLGEHPDVDVVGEADGVDAALALIRAEEPDAVFLDVQMPGRSGFDLLDALDRPLEVVFATAFDAYAIRAFEVNALDYLLKPVSRARLARALERLRARAGADGGTLPAGGPTLRPLEYDDRILVTADERPRLLRVDSIACIRAAGDYSEVLTGDRRTLLVQKPLREWEARLPARHFVRVHRSTIVNVGHVDAIEEGFNRSYVLKLRALDEPILVSRRYGGELRARFS